MNARRKFKSVEKRLLLDELYIRDGRNSHYCGIAVTNFQKIWGAGFCGGSWRGRKLEIDREDNFSSYTLENCILAWAICNMDKSDKFTHDEY